MLNFFEQAGRYSYFAVHASLAVLPAFTRPRELVRQLYAIHVGALLLATVAGIALGAVIWMHLHHVLARLGTGYTQLLPEAIALAVVLEFAPIGAGLIVAGRSGASLGAELGSMRLTEQIDALEVMGLSPWRQLIGPRVAACVIALPLLTGIIDGFALLASYGAEWLGGSMTLQEYWNQSLRGLQLRDVIPATLKTCVFGFLVGVTGCFFGMHATGGTEGVGRAATRGVVLSIFLVVVSDVILVRLIQLVAQT